MDETTRADALERELERLAEVRAARVVEGPAGRILEIHLVSDGSKPPKQLTRDVETVAATQGFDIDRRTISIAQIPTTSGSPSSRLDLASLQLTTEGNVRTCRVRVTRSGEDAIGEASAAASSSGRLRLVARATIDAAHALLGEQVAAECENALVVDVGEHPVALVVLVAVGPAGQQTIVPGVHPVRDDADDATAAAVLDALHRLLGV